MNIEQLKYYTGTSIVESNCEKTYPELYEQVINYRTQLKSLLNQHDVVIIDSDYSFYSVSLILAIAEFPVIVVPIVRTTDDEFMIKQTISGANKIITLNRDEISCNDIKDDPEHHSDHIEITSASNSGIVLFTSGTTGTPKVMVHNFSNLIHSFAAPRRQRSLRFLLFLMFDHIGGLNTLLSCLNNGSPIILPKDRNPETVLDCIQNHQVQVLPTSPTFLNMLLMLDNFKDKNLSSLKLITYGTERMPVELLSKLNESIPGVKFLQTFGTSETGIVKTKSKSSQSLFFKIEDEDVEYKVEEGQLFLKTKTSVKGYKSLKSEKFTADGWFATGDLVEVDEEGYMKVKGRINEVINVGGLKVMPEEIEQVINSVAGVIDATVYSENNAITGQMVCANVIVNNDANKAELKKAIKKECLQKLDKYKRPVRINFKQQLKATSRFKKSMVA